MFPPGAELERVCTGGVHTEGPAVAPDETLFFRGIAIGFASGVRAGESLTFSPATGEVRVFRSPSGMAAGLALDGRGDLLATGGADFGGRRVTRTDMRTGRAVVLAGLVDGRPFDAPSDLVLDGRGRVFFTGARYFGHEPVEQPAFGVHRIDPGGAVARLAVRGRGEAQRHRALAGRADALRPRHRHRALDPRLVGGLPRGGAPHRTWAYDLRGDGSAGGRRAFVDLAGERGAGERGAGGLKVDADGDLHAAVLSPGRMGVRVYSPAGDEIAHMPVPEPPWNLALGPDRGRTVLYVTAGGSVYRVPVLTRPLGRR